MTVLTQFSASDAAVDVRETLNVVLGQTGKASGAVSIASELSSIGWDTANFSIPTLAIETLNGTSRCTNVDVEAMWKASCIAQGLGDPATWPTYYVRQDGSNSNTGASEAQAFFTLDKAVTVANAAGVAARIMVKAGYFARSQNWSSATGLVEPTVPLAMYAYGGRVVCSTADDGVAWTADGTYPWVYSCARSNALRVLDLKARTSRGHYPDLVKLATASALAVSRVPGSWATDGTTVWVNRPLNDAVAVANTRVLMKIRNFAHTYKAMKHFFFGGAAAGDGFDFEGGLITANAGGAADGGCIAVAYNNASQVPASKVIMAAKNCTFRYAGGPSTDSSSETDNVQIRGLHGLAAFQDCDASDSSKDGFNQHGGATIGAASSFLTVNCVGYDNGRGTSISNNSWTLHEDCIGVSICDDWAGARGSTVHIIDTAKALIVGTTSRESLGDIVTGGTTDPVEFRTAGTAVMYVRLCRAIPGAPSYVAARADDTSSILGRDSVLRGALRTFGSGTIGSY